MARIFIEGFETGDAGLWDECSNPSVVQQNAATNGMGGNWCIYSSTTPYTFIKYVPGKNEYYLALSIKPSTYCQAVCSFSYGDTPLITLTRNPDNSGILSLRKGGDTGTVLGASTFLKGTPAMAKADLLLHIVIAEAASGGMVSLKVNGKQSISVSGINTTTANTPALINRLIIGCANNNILSGGFVDDIVLDDANAPIKPRIIGLVPNANGSWSEFTASNGTSDHYTVVNETPSSDTNYVLVNEVGKRETYNITDLPPLLTDIRCLQVSARAWYEGNAAAKHIKLIAKTSLTELTSDSLALSEYPVDYTYILETNPDTGVQFTAAEISSLEIGILTVA